MGPALSLLHFFKGSQGESIAHALAGLLYLEIEKKNWKNIDLLIPLCDRSNLLAEKIRELMPECRIEKIGFRKKEPLFGKNVLFIALSSDEDKKLIKKAVSLIKKRFAQHLYLATFIGSF